MACVQIEFEIPPELQIGDSDSDATPASFYFRSNLLHAGWEERGLPGVEFEFVGGARGSLGRSTATRCNSS